MKGIEEGDEVEKVSKMLASLRGKYLVGSRTDRMCG